MPRPASEAPVPSAEDELPRPLVPDVICATSLSEMEWFTRRTILRDGFGNIAPDSSGRPQRGPQVGGWQRRKDECAGNRVADADNSGLPVLWATAGSLPNHLHPCCSCDFHLQRKVRHHAIYFFHFHFQQSSKHRVPADHSEM